MKVCRRMFYPAVCHTVGLQKAFCRMQRKTQKKTFNFRGNLKINEANFSKRQLNLYHTTRRHTRKVSVLHSTGGENSKSRKANTNVEIIVCLNNTDLRESKKITTGVCYYHCYYVNIPLTSSGQNNGRIWCQSGFLGRISLFLNS